MTAPIITPKVLLVPDPRDAAAPRTVPLRRYRLARLRFDGAATHPERRFDHLRRVYD